MKGNSKNKFTLKIIFSYLALTAIVLVSGYFIFKEIRVFLYDNQMEETDAKLLKTGSLFTELYEAESLSKLALQTKTQQNFAAYSAKIDTIIMEIDTLKQLSTTAHHKGLLDSLQLFLRQKVANSNALRKLKVKNEANNSIDNALKEFRKMESSIGKLTIYNFEPNPEKLTPYKRKVLEDWVAYLNKNIPADGTEIPDSDKIDSILSASKILLVEAKKNDAKTQRFLAQKEQEITSNDLILSQQLRSIISAFEQEMVVNSYNQSLGRQDALRKSVRLAAMTILLGFLVAALFTFLINRDYWRVQTYRQQLEKEKKFSESLLKSREQLISTVSHDLRTPLNTITGYAELMDETPLNDKQQRYLKHLQSASEYVVNLVNDLLDFSKLEAGKLKIEKKSFQLASLIRETAENLQAINAQKDLDLVVDIDPELQQHVLGDPFRIRQILSNLIGNAFKFTQEGTITIKAKANMRGKSMMAQIAVSDTGIGIAEDQQRQIFKEFTQADAQIERRFGGYGLGLTISKKLTELLEGRLHLKSAIGKGSTFTLELPLQLSKETGLNAKTQSFMAQNIQLLIIDDDASLLRLLGELCESLGITAHIYNDFEEVGQNEPLEYQMVLTDIQMPTLNGFEVLQKLKSGHYAHYAHQPIVAMTGRRDLEDEHYTNKGFAQVLQKPFTKDQLIDILGTQGLIANTISNTENKKVVQKPTSTLFDLDLIRSFLGDNETAIQEVLQTFHAETINNMLILETAIERRQYALINQTTHRMLPMFRQLKVNSCISLLEKFEVAKETSTPAMDLDIGLKVLGEAVLSMMAAMEAQTIISPTYNG
ncbi:MAG: ATP-binding protein [Flavobacteriaceae bacterium]